MNKHALLIGINEYSAASNLSPLRYAERDAIELAEVLDSSYDFSVQTLLGDEATRDAIEDALYSLPGGDTFLFFFAGHGQELRGQYCLHPANSHASGVGTLPFESLSRYWGREFNFDKVLAICDACRNEAVRGGASRGFASSRDIERSMVGDSLVEVLYGCSDGEVSYEEEELEHGLFTGSLLQVLREQVGGLDSRVLADKANDVMRSWCSRKNRSQRAKRYYEPSEKFRIVLREGAKPGAIKESPKETPPPPSAPPSMELVRCPICGKKNTPIETFYCRECGRDDLCLTHQNGESFLCVECVQKEEPPQPPPSPQPKLLPCAVCGKKNTEEQTFDCPGCGRKHLCLTHQNGESFLCNECEEKRLDGERETKRLAAEKAEQERLAAQKEKERLEGPFGKEYRDKTTGMEFVWVPPGRFEMGDTFGDGVSDEQPVHSVTLEGFYMAKYPVTQGEYKKVMGKNPSRFLKQKTERATRIEKGWFRSREVVDEWQVFEDNPLHPVESVSWNDAQTFIKKLNAASGKKYSLPSESQWEYAARSGGRKEKYAGGEDVDAVAWYGKNSGGSTHEVGTKQANGLGLYDMSGNVYEWCQDSWHDSYKGAPTDGTAWEAGGGSARVVRGGSWSSFPGSVRAANRNVSRPVSDDFNLGFRLVFSVY